MARAEEIQKVNTFPISQQPQRKEILVGWLPPTWRWCKLNIDGAYKSTGNSSAGGVIRDSFGNWISGLCMTIGASSSSVTMVELWGLSQGLSLAWSTGIRRFFFEV